MRTRAVTSLLVLAAVAATAACSKAAPSAMSADAVAGRYGYRVADATLTPVYALVPGFKKTRLISTPATS
ncbi:hypothetical protein ET495_05485 [Xylanimonas allomyrinae]|uniref:Uncharacterized protein n=1 Tax=Xylanimonas allomyrinae TaxID=2509459 RepID=A0A4P6EXM6_9MICO|nr:hypothetical protein [Xylanimonas allomyrinae]QAY62798.1 hypothetical protein ET495_05485 [Xylanimonas allomyrinae]